MYLLFALFYDVTGEKELTQVQPEDGMDQSLHFFHQNQCCPLIQLEDDDTYPLEIAGMPFPHLFFEHAIVEGVQESTHWFLEKKILEGFTQRRMIQLDLPHFIGLIATMSTEAPANQTDQANKENEKQKTLE